MFKIGTLIPTNRGVVPIEQFGFARQENEESECKANLMLKTYEGDWNRCIYQTYKKSKGIKVKLTSKFSIECSIDQIVLTPKGFKSLKKMKIGDEICCYIDTYIDKSSYFTETERIGYIPKQNNDIYLAIEKRSPF